MSMNVEGAASESSLERDRRGWRSGWWFVLSSVKLALLLCEVVGESALEGLAYGGSRLNLFASTRNSEAAGCSSITPTDTHTSAPFSEYRLLYIHNMATQVASSGNAGNATFKVRVPYLKLPR